MKLKVYHGSQDSNLKLEERPIYLIDDKKSAIAWANGYAFGGDLFEEDEPTLYTIEVTFNNPKYIYTEDEYFEFMDITSTEHFVPELKKLGHDGVIIEKDYNNGASYYMPLNAKEQCVILKKENVDKRLQEQYSSVYKRLNKQLEEYL